MLALCLMLSVTLYTENYAGIIGGSLVPVFMSSVVRLVAIMCMKLHGLRTAIAWCRNYDTNKHDERAVDNWL